jgi:hypothetical protein
LPGFILHLGATVQCSHAGPAIPTVTSPRVLVGGQPATTLAPYTVAGCTFPPPPNGNGPCVIANWVTSATRVLAGGMPVLLFDSQAICAPTGTPVLIVASQVRVKGT